MLSRFEDDVILHGMIVLMKASSFLPAVDFKRFGWSDHVATISQNA